CVIRPQPTGAPVCCWGSARGRLCAAAGRRMGSLHVYFQLLGTLKVRRDEERVDLGGLRQQRLLAMLLLDPNRVVSAERLIEAMWDGDPPATARRQLHNAVAAIRRGFAAAKHVIVKDGPGYLIQVDPSDIDAHRFTTMLARAGASGGHRAESID